MAKRERSPCDRPDDVPAPAAKRQRRVPLPTTPPYTNSVSPLPALDPVDDIAAARSSHSHGHSKSTHHHLDDGTWGALTAPSAPTPNCYSPSPKPITDPAVEQHNVNLLSVSSPPPGSYQTGQDSYDGGTQLVAPPNPDDLRRGLARSPIVSSSITDAFFAPYDPNFGAKVQAHMRFRVEHERIRQIWRVNKYGSEVAEQWRRGHTPVDIRAAYWEEQDRMIQENLLDSDTDFEDMIAPDDVKVGKKKVRDGIDEGGRASKGMDEARKGDDALRVPDDTDK